MVEEFSFESTNGKNTIYGKYMFHNDATNIRGIVQICHGMCEYIDKYDNFANYLVDKGFVVVRT